MRDIRFRGMCKNGVMRFGRLSQDKEGSTLYYNDYSQRICWDNTNIPVSNKSLGQFTGLTDKNGKDIYEGDVLDLTGEGKHFGHVSFNDETCAFCAHSSDLSVKDRSDHLYGAETTVVIGNIHENPELLEPKS